MPHILANRRVVLASATTDPIRTSPVYAMTGWALAIVPSWLYGQSQENYASLGATAVSADTDPVGQFTSFGPDCHICGTASGTSTRPLLSSGRGASAAFSLTGGTFYGVQNSIAGPLDFIHKTGIFSFAFWWSPTTITNQMLFNNNNGAGNKIGIGCEMLNTTGKIEVYITNGAAVNWDVTTDDTFTAATTGKWIFGKCDGTTLSIKIGSGSWKTGSKSNSLSTSSASDLFTVGRTSSGGTKAANGLSGPLLINTGILTDQQFATINAWTPTRTTDRPYPFSTTLASLYAWGHWPAYSNTYCFTNTNGTGAVSANGDAIACIKHRVSVANSLVLNRDWTTVGGATAPVRNTSTGLGSNGVLWNSGRTTDELGLPLAMCTPRNHTIIAVIGKSPSASVNREFLNYSGGQSNYGIHDLENSVASGNHPNLVWHPGSTPPSGGPNTNTLGSNRGNVFALRRIGSAMTGWANGALDDTQMNTSLCLHDRCGQGRGHNDNAYQMVGDWFEPAALPYGLTDSEMVTLLTGLVAQHGT